MGNNNTTFKFTHKGLKAVPLTKRGQELHTDINKLSGKAKGTFLFRVTKGSKAFVLRCWPDGKKREINCDYFPATTLAEARNVALDMLDNISQGLDPETGDNGHDTARTMQEVWEEYQAERNGLDVKGGQPKKAPRTCYTEDKMWENHLAPRFAEEMRDLDHWKSQKGKTKGQDLQNLVDVVGDLLKTCRLAKEESKRSLWEAIRAFFRNCQVDSMETILRAIAHGIDEPALKEVCRT